MKYTLDIHPRVTQEAGKVHAYRENEREGAGDRFLQALDECYDSILANPHRYGVRKGPFHHALLRKMKYRVVYRVKGGTVYVVQVRHTSRKPSKRYGP